MLGEFGGLELSDFGCGVGLAWWTGWAGWAGWCASSKSPLNSGIQIQVLSGDLRHGG